MVIRMKMFTFFLSDDEISPHKFFLRKIYFGDGKHLRGN